MTNHTNLAQGIEMSLLTKAVAVLTYCLSLQLFVQQSQAVALNPGGTGQVLLYPYYTVTDNQDTLITITNSRAESKVLKVTFRESLNSERVFSFHLFLAPNDHWSAVITRHDNSAALLTTDNSCTMPLDIAATASAPQGPQSVFTFESEAQNLKNNGPERTLSGHLEVLEMGVLNETIDRLIKGPNRRCNLLTNEYQQRNISRRMKAPSGGLSGYGVIINPKQGTAVNYNAEALVQFTDEEIFSFPADYLPDLRSGNSKQAYLPHNKGVRILDFKESIDAVSAVLTKSVINQDYALDQSLNARSYWVATMPTKYFYTHPIDPKPPFSVSWNIINSEACLSTADYVRQDILKPPENMTLFSREAQEYSTDLFRCIYNGIGSPSIPATCTSEPFELCYAANLMDLANSNNFMGLNRDISTSSAEFLPNWNSEGYRPFQNGRISYNFGQFELESESGTRIKGLPVIGFTTQIYVNGALSGTIANYAVSTKITGRRVFGDKD